LNYKKSSWKKKHKNMLSIPSKQFTNQSGCEPLKSDNDLWKAENGVFVLIK